MKNSFGVGSGKNFGDVIRVAVFYDGNFFLHVSNYYTYDHPRRSRISISGLHRYIVSKIAEEEGIPQRRCRVVDAHYFRGRISHQLANDEMLRRERKFDETLMIEGVTAHYLPVSSLERSDGTIKNMEKGIDVWLAVEALEASITKGLDVVVLVAGDGDYLPLIRKLNSYGTQVMVVGWDFSVEVDGRERITRTAQSIINEANLSVMMNQVIDDRTNKNDPIIDGLFIDKRTTNRGSFTGVSRPSPQNKDSGAENEEAHASGGEEPMEKQNQNGKRRGRILKIFKGDPYMKKGGNYGFIDEGKGDNKGRFFHASSVTGKRSFDKLSIGDLVEYELGENNLDDSRGKGSLIASKVWYVGKA